MTDRASSSLGELAVPADDPRLFGLRCLLGLMDRLRGPGGCPWDRRQTHASLRGYLLEETYELLEALDAGDLEHVREELGDLLFQVVFHARIAEEEGRFHLGEVAAGIARKLYGRHPHVFEDGVAPSSDEELARAWAAHKRREGRRSVLDGVPRALPALLRAQRVQAKAAQVGFDWGDARGPLEKLEEEIDELRAEIAGADAEAVRSELGDVLFTAVNLARHLGVDAEAALREATERFVRRFRWVEAAGGDLTALSDERLEALWEEAKQRLEGEGG